MSRQHCENYESNRKQFTVAHEMLTAVARHLSITWLFFHRFDPFALGNSEFCFPRISMFPPTSSRDQSLSVYYRKHSLRYQGPHTWSKIDNLLNPIWNDWLYYPCNLIGSQWCDEFTYRTIFCSKSQVFLSRWEWGSKTKQSIRFQGSIKAINKISVKWKAKSHCMENFATTIAKTLLFLQVFLQKLCDFKMDVIKWQLNFVLCNFGLKSY